MRNNIGTNNWIRRFGRGAAWVGLLIAVAVFSQTAVAFQVAPLPAGNLVVNPWFRSDSQPNEAGLDHWIDAAGPGVHWSGSQKAPNPTPDDIRSPKCGDRPYCGTAARFGKPKGGSGGPDFANEAAYLYQVIPADSSQRKLIFFTHWVTDHLAEASITIYGSDSADGPWSEVWVTLDAPLGKGSARDWVQTEWMETTIEKGYPFYKIEFYTLYLPEGSGAKFTGVYFAVADVDDGITPMPPATEIAAAPTAVEVPDPPATMAPAVSAPPTQANDAKPVIFTATAVSPTEIELNWSVDDADLRGFKIERSLDGIAGWQEIAKVEADGRAYTDEDLAAETIYFYRVRVSLLDSNSYYLDAVSAMTETVATVTPLIPTIAPPTATAMIDQSTATAVLETDVLATPVLVTPVLVTPVTNYPPPASTSTRWLWVAVGSGVVLAVIWLVIQSRRS